MLHGALSNEAQKKSRKKKVCLLSILVRITTGINQYIFTNLSIAMLSYITHFFGDVIQDAFLLRNTWSGIHVFAKAAWTLNIHITHTYRSILSSEHIFRTQLLKLKKVQRQTIVLRLYNLKPKLWLWNWFDL